VVPPSKFRQRVWRDVFSDRHISLESEGDISLFSPPPPSLFLSFPQSTSEFHIGEYQLARIPGFPWHPRGIRIACRCCLRLPNSSLHRTDPERSCTTTSISVFPSGFGIYRRCWNPLRPSPSTARRVKRGSTGF